MVYKFRLISNEVHEFVRDVEILSDQTFYDLHRSITHDLHYDKSQIASFFLSNEKWEKLEEVTLFDMTEGESGVETYVMDQTRMDHLISEEKQRMLYVFDFFNERVLFIELHSIRERKDKETFPRISLSKGDPPVQILNDFNNLNDFGLDD